MRLGFLILGVVGAACITPSVQAGDSKPSLIDATATDEILNLARGYGSATLGTQDDGSPKIYGKIEGQPYTIYFSNCDSDTHGNCEDLDLYTGYLGVKPTLEKLNSWNRDTRFARAYLDTDGDAGLDMDVNLQHGVTPDNFNSTLSLWAQLISKYSAFVTGN